MAVAHVLHALYAIKNIAKNSGETLDVPPSGSRNCLSDVSGNLWNIQEKKESCMRFIHTADLHIDSPLRGLSRYEGAPLERLRGATRRALERLVELAIDEQVDFVLIAGDLYDRDWQDFHTGLFVREQMVRLGRANIRVFIVQGNHDARGVITRQIPWPDNVKVFSSRSAETVHLADLGVAIHGHSFPDREVPEDLVPGYPAAMPGCFNIGLLHTSLTGVEGHDTYAPTTLPVIKSKGYDYWALGHVHARQVVCEVPRVVFPGNLQGRHARETGLKGCELVTVNGGLLEASFMPLDVVRWHQIRIDLQPVQTLDELPRHVTQALRACVTAAASLAVHTASIASSALAVTSCVKQQCVATFLVWSRLAGKASIPSRTGQSCKRLVCVERDFESSPFWGLIHFRGVSRMIGSPEPVLSFARSFSATSCSRKANYFCNRSV